MQYIPDLYSISMTAIVIVYTPSGFVIAADGRSRWGDEAAASATTQEMESDKTQKIFFAEAPGCYLAYAISGVLIVNESGSFNLLAEANRQAKLLSERRSGTWNDYVKAFARNLKRYIGEAKRDGRIESYPENKYGAHKSLLASIYFVGYFEGSPRWTNLNLSHRSQAKVIEEYEHPGLTSGENRAYGSVIIPDLAKAGDPRFVKYKAALELDLFKGSLQTAIDYAVAYIQACSEDCAAEIDPICRGIGGRIHIAIVTPLDGFQWVPGFEPTQSTPADPIHDS